MNYTVKQIANLSGMSEHTIRYYTDQGLLPCERDAANRRIFNEESLNWIHTINCLKGCGMSIEAIRHYCELCMLEETEDTLNERYQMILDYKKLAYEKLEEAKNLVAYMERKTTYYEDVIAGKCPDMTNPHHKNLPEAATL